jgi:enterochelin esterase family protein
VPKGKLEGPFLFKSQILTNTVRRYWVYVPAQYTSDKSANVLVFQDGQRATNPEGALRVPQVLENLIHKGDIPVTIGIFITPGQRGGEYPDDLAMRNPNNRAAEYDSLSDSYARFIAKKCRGRQELQSDKDPERRAIGVSSGAILRYGGKQRPDEFRNVISMIGSYTSIGYRAKRDGQPMTPGGDLYPTLI